MEAPCPLPRIRQVAATVALSTSLRTVGVTQLTSVLHRLVGQALEEPGQGRVLVVDGGGSKRCALLGDNIAEMAVRNGWSVRAHVDLLLPVCTVAALCTLHCPRDACITAYGPRSPGSGSWCWFAPGGDAKPCSRV